MNNAQLTAIRNMQHAQSDALASEIVTVARTAHDTYEVRKGCRLVGVTHTWEGANELAGFAGRK